MIDSAPPAPTPDQIAAGFGCFANHGFWDALDLAHELGFAGVELLGVEGSRHSVGVLPGQWLDQLGEADLERLRSALARFRRTAVHSPFVDAPLFTYNRYIAAESFRQVARCVEAAGALGMEAVAVHANRRSGLDARDYWDDMVRVFRALGDVAARVGTLVGVETGYPDRYEDFLGLIQAIDHPAVGATVDIGHVAFLLESGPRSTPEGVANYNRNLVALCRDLGSKLVHMHWHDVRFADWRDHRSLGTGVVDLPPLVTALREIGYAGMLTFELEEPDQIPALRESKARLEAHLYASR